MVYWVGSKNKTDGPFWVYDQEAQHPDPNMVYLYSVFSNRMKEHNKIEVKRDFNTVIGARAEWAFEQYDAWRKADGATFLVDDRQRATLEYEVRLQQRRAEAIERHRERLDRGGKDYQGVSVSPDVTFREAHCWSCKQPLDSRIDVQCNACEWMICACGACRCNYGDRRKED